jgi:predicted metal-binding membrane protein
MMGAIRTPDDVRWYRLSLGALVVAAWIALAAWGASPFAGLLSHREIGRASLPLLLRLSIFTGGWMLMTIAMMLPGSLPLINLFRRMVDRRPDRPRLVALLILGYLGVWAVFGVAAYRGDAYVHEAVTRLPAFGAASTWIGVGLLLVAGLYQITPLKQMCLDKCRSPYSFLVEHWRGKLPGRDAFRLGVRHGLFCVGCCWTLMLLMFAIGGANLGWMLALGALMAAERTVRWGRRLTAPVGLLLVLCALGLAYRVPLVVAAFGGP